MALNRRPIDSDSDALADLMSAVHPRCTVVAYADLMGPWGFRLNGLSDGIFHIMHSGNAALWMNGTTTLLESGDMVILPHGHDHELRDRYSTACVDLNFPRAPRQETSRKRFHMSAFQLDTNGRLSQPTTEMLRIDMAHRPPGVTTLSIGNFQFQHAHAGALLHILPPVMGIRGEAGDVPRWHKAIIELVNIETESSRAGSTAILERLNEIFFVESVLAYFQQLGSSYLRALTPAPSSKSSTVSIALSKIQMNPGARWTLARLAAEANMSRTAFAVAFTRLTGEAPLKCVTRLRLAMAAKQLAENELPISHIGELVGFRGRTAFHRAFRRQFGMTPREYRRRESLSHVP
jgi:AraC-like DNA-binding protein